MEHQLQIAPHHTTVASRGKKNGTLVTLSSGATSGVFLHYCCYHDSVTVLTANRWQRKALAAGTVHHTEGIIVCNLLPYTSCRIMPRS